MDAEGSINPVDTKIERGGADSPALDMTTEKDRGTVRMATKRWPKRWRGLTPEFKDRLCEDLLLAANIARRVGESTCDDEVALKAANALASVVKTGHAMEAQEQADEHLADKNARLDAGQLTENVGLQTPMKYIEGVDESKL